ncbi:MAG: septum formation protein Maf [Candidatus Cloacimonadota bacterium]|nr:MAG: septum formation protein Maf [Candidatus Cloacimonadota bacterium]
MFISDKKIILGSGSPRRKELFSILCKEHKILTTDKEKDIDQSEPISFVQENAFIKAAAVLDDLKGVNDALIFGFDTVVSLDNEVLGKPKSREDAKKMLQKLSNNQHLVSTGYCILNSQKEIVLKSCDISYVHFGLISEPLIEWYLDQNEYADKAGSYGIQGEARIFIKKINGCYYNVMGLPVSKMFYEMEKLKEFTLSF